MFGFKAAFLMQKGSISLAIVWMVVISLVLFWLPVACGRFSWAEDDILPGDFSMEEILEERLGDLEIPLVLNLPLGHGQPNQALPLGAIAELDGHQGTLRLIQ